MTKNDDDKTDDMFGEKPKQPEPTGEQLRDEGIARAVSGAEKENPPEWSERVFEFATGYAGKFRDFTTEDIRLAAPADLQVKQNKAWGFLPRMLVAHGVAVFTDEWRRARNPKAHKCPKQVLRSLIYAGPRE